MGSIAEINFRTPVARGVLVMSWFGLLGARGDLAAGAAISSGCTPLEAHLTGQIASLPLGSWRTDRVTAADIVQHNGKNPHPRSVARSRRNLAARGILMSRRIMPGQRPHPDAKHTSGAGTTLKVVNFDKLRVRDPLPPSERRRLGHRQLSPNAAQMPVHVVPAHVTQRARYSSTPPVMPAELARVVSSLGETLERKWDREGVAKDQATMDAVLHPSTPSKPRGPP